MHTSIDGQRGLQNLGNSEHREYMYYENEIQLTLDLDFSETVGREESIRASIQRDIAYALGGDPDKVWVGTLRAGSVVAEVRLEKGCLAVSHTFSDVLVFARFHFDLACLDLNELLVNCSFCVI